MPNPFQGYDSTEEFLRKDPDPSRLQDYLATKKMWLEMPSPDLQRKAQEDYQSNVISPPMWRSDEYMKFWNAEKDAAGQGQGMYQLSPNQLREKGIKP